MTTQACPESRLRTLVDRPERVDEDYVLYWMIGERRPTHNFALQHAVHRAKALGKPLVVLEPLDCTYAWACDRFHAFIIQGMTENNTIFSESDATYYPYVEPSAHQGQGLLAALAERACLVITDDRPGYRFPALLIRAAHSVKRRFIAVDGAGVLPLTTAPKVYKRAVDFRRYVHKTFSHEAPVRPIPEPLNDLPATPAPTLAAIHAEWPKADLPTLNAPGGLASLPIDHSIPAVPDRPGGPTAAARRLEEFLERKLESYPERNHPDKDVASGLSPWLHFGHVGGAQVAWAVLDASGWQREGMDASRFSKQEGVYLPATRLRQRGLEPERLIEAAQQGPELTGEERASLSAVVTDLINEADRYYASADLGMRWIPWRSRLAIRVASRVYRAIGVKLRKNGGDAWAGRTRVGMWGKVRWTIAALILTARSIVREHPTHQTELHRNLRDLPGCQE